MRVFPARQRRRLFECQILLLSYRHSRKLRIFFRAIFLCFNVLFKESSEKSFCLRIVGFARDKIIVSRGVVVRKITNNQFHLFISLSHSRSISVVSSIALRSPSTEMHSSGWWTPPCPAGIKRFGPQRLVPISTAFFRYCR